MIALLIVVNLMIVTLSGIILLKLSAAKHNPTGTWYGWLMIASAGWYFVPLLQSVLPSAPAPPLGLGLYLLESLGLRVAPYFYFLANLADSPRWDHVKVQVIARVAALSLLALYLMDLFWLKEILAAPWPVAAVSRGALGMAPLGYIGLAYLLCLDSYRSETQAISRRRRLYMLGVNALIFPLSLAAFGVLPLGGGFRIIAGQGWMVYGVLFMTLIVRDKLFDIKIRLELSISPRSANWGISMLNHTLKNELDKVHYYLQKLARKTSNPGEIREEIQEIAAAREHLMEIMARIREKTLAVVVEEQRASLNEILGQTLRSWGPWLEEKKIRVAAPLAVEVILMCDPVHLQEVIGNILLNAAEAMSNGGRIVISMERTRRYLILKIEDNGPGIPKEHLHHVSEPFYSTKKQQSASFGLGLTYCCNIMRSHGGALEIRSEEQQGTTIALKFPLRKVKEIRALSPPLVFLNPENEEGKAHGLH